MIILSYTYNLNKKKSKIIFTYIRTISYQSFLKNLNIFPHKNVINLSQK